MIDVADKDRLLKLIGMLGSTFDNERAVAATKIGDIAAKYRLTINELMAEAHGQTPAPRQDPPPPDPGADPFTDTMLQAVRGLFEHYARVLTPWELKFCDDVSLRYSRDYELSEKQIAIIERIVAKVNRYNNRTWNNV